MLIYFSEYSTSLQCLEVTLLGVKQCDEEGSLRANQMSHLTTEAWEARGAVWLEQGKLHSMTATTRPAESVESVSKL